MPVAMGRLRQKIPVFKKIEERLSTRARGADLPIRRPPSSGIGGRRSGERGGDRTHDREIKSLLLYH